MNVLKRFAEKEADYWLYEARLEGQRLQKFREMEMERVETGWRQAEKSLNIAIQEKQQAEQEKQQAIQEKQQAEREKQQAEREKQQAEREVNQMRDLLKQAGLSPDKLLKS
ncbi:MAG: hypothetical protein HQM12_16450 [SAR324 cluster bacterium]|nr:hypothetical protein [SAR324 cluster bacterium]